MPFTELEQLLILEHDVIVAIPYLSDLQRLRLRKEMRQFAKLNARVHFLKHYHTDEQNPMNFNIALNSALEFGIQFAAKFIQKYREPDPFVYPISES